MWNVALLSDTELYRQEETTEPPSKWFLLTMLNAHPRPEGIGIPLPFLRLLNIQTNSPLRAKPSLRRRRLRWQFGSPRILARTRARRPHLIFRNTCHLHIASCKAKAAPSKDPRNNGSYKSHQASIAVLSVPLDTFAWVVPKTNAVVCKFKQIAPGAPTTFCFDMLLATTA